MSTSRLKQVIGVCVALATGAVASCGDNNEGEVGEIAVKITAAPVAVLSLRVVVSDIDFADITTTLTQNISGDWVGTVENVPVGSGRTLTALGYSVAPAPAASDTTNLIFKGITTVVVNANNPNTTNIVLTPFPPDGGTGINTPPILVSLIHAPQVGANGTAVLRATAIDPDADETLTYLWTTADNVGSFDTAILTGIPGEEISVTYTPPVTAQTVTVTLLVTDLHSGMATTSFQIQVVDEGIIDVNVDFEIMPNLSITSAVSQVLLPLASTQINYLLSANINETPVAVTAAWTDTCGGEFTVFDTTPDLGAQSVIYSAPVVGPVDLRCDLKLTLTGPAPTSAVVSTTVIVWEPARIAFVTSTDVEGDFGGVGGADDICNERATAGGLLGDYRAIVSSTEESAKTHLDEGPYVLRDGTPVAASKEVMFTTGLAHAIDLDELGVSHTILPLAVYTGTDAAGGTTTDTCLDWASNNSGESGTLGTTNGTLAAGWVDSNRTDCDTSASLYCVQRMPDLKK